LLRVEPSDAAPHERLNDRGRFEVRRGTEITGMTLRELESLLRRRDSEDYDDLDAARARSYGMLSFDRSVSERVVGGTLFPETVARDEPLSRTRQREIERIVSHIDRLNAAIPETYCEGILFETRMIVPEGAKVVDEFGLRRQARVAYVAANGRIELRLQVNSSSYEGPLIGILCSIYALGSQVLLALSLGPRASGAIICHRGNPPDVERPHQPAGGEYEYDVNFATDTVEEMARRPLMFALRAAGVLIDPGELDSKVTEHWRQAYSGLIKDDLRLGWQ
jgi:hypothetical protein